MASWLLLKMSPILATKAEAMTLLMVLKTVKMRPLRVVLVWGGKRGFRDQSLWK